MQTLNEFKMKRKRTIASLLEANKINSNETNNRKTLIKEYFQCNIENISNNETKTKKYNSDDNLLIDKQELPNPIKHQEEINEEELKKEKTKRPLQIKKRERNISNNSRSSCSVSSRDSSSRSTSKSVSSVSKVICSNKKPIKKSKIKDIVLNKQENEEEEEEEAAAVCLFSFKNSIDLTMKTKCNNDQTESEKKRIILKKKRLSKIKDFIQVTNNDCPKELTPKLIDQLKEKNLEFDNESENLTNDSIKTDKIINSIETTNLKLKRKSITKLKRTKIKDYLISNCLDNYQNSKGLMNKKIAELILNDNKNNNKNNKIDQQHDKPKLNNLRKLKLNKLVKSNSNNKKINNNNCNNDTSLIKNKSTIKQYFEICHHAKSLKEKIKSISINNKENHGQNFKLESNYEFLNGTK